MSLFDCLISVDTPEGRARVQAYLATQPFPHVESVPGSPGLLERIEADGTRSVGRFVDRQFLCEPVGAEVDQSIPPVAPSESL